MTLLLPSDYLQTDPFYGNVPILLHGDGVNGSTTFIDSSASARTPLYVGGNVSISTAQSRFGGSSLAFDGNGDYLGYASSTDFDLPADFTIEFWVYRAGSSVQTQGLAVRRRLDTAGTGAWGIGIDPSNNMYWGKLESPTYGLTIGSSVLATWQHVAVCREAGMVRVYLDGVLTARQRDTTNYTSSFDLFLGSWGRAGNGTLPNQEWLNGYIEDFRITKGVARYGSSFIPPLAAYPDAASR